MKRMFIILGVFILATVIIASGLVLRGFHYRPNLLQAFVSQKMSKPPIPTSTPSTKASSAAHKDNGQKTTPSSEKQKDAFINNA